MIKVYYLPVIITISPLPNGDSDYIFKSQEEFVSWVKTYICEHCKESFKEWYGFVPFTLGDYMKTGCGVEIEIEDDDNQINWEEIM